MRNRRKLERRTKNKSALIRQNLLIKMDTRYSWKKKVDILGIYRKNR